MQLMNEVLKFKFSQFRFIDNNYSLSIDQSKYKKYTTLTRETDPIRIVKHLNSENKLPLVKDSVFSFIKDIIVVDMDETNLYKLSKGIIVFNKEKFKRLLASSSNIRNCKVVFVKESLFDKVNKILLCGLPEDLEHDCFAKFSSYYALCNTDSIPVKNLPRIVVINDFRHKISENFDLVKETDADSYEAEEDKLYETEIFPFDGAGLVNYNTAENWAYKDLELNYVPASFQIRAIPCLKGNLFTFPIDEFVKEYEVTNITDVWGKTWDLFDEKGNIAIDIIMTKSQFKFKDFHNSYDEWLEAFTEDIYGYKRTFNISGWSKNSKELPKKSVLSYQPLQTLSLNKTQVKNLCQTTLDIYKSIRTDVSQFIKFRGITNKEFDAETGVEIEKFMPPFYEALEHNKALFDDDYIQSKVKDDLKGFRDRSCKGMLFLNKTNYQTLVPDLVALAEHAFNLKVKGVLKKGEMYNRFWYDKEVRKMALCRFPHIAREWKVVNVVKPEDNNMKYLEYTNEGYMINIWDSAALRMGTADFDGDCIYGVSDETLLSVIVDQESRTILHIFPEETDENNKPKKKYPINNIDKLIESDCRGMDGGIGQCVNDITILWNLPQSEERDKYILMLSVVGAKIIDFAKSGIAAKTPDVVKEFLNNKKLPYFMKYKYKSIASNEKRRNKIRAIKGLSEVHILNRYDSTVNMICKHMEEQFDLMNAEIDKRIKGEAGSEKGKFEWYKLLNNKANQYSETYKTIKAKMEKFNKMHSQLSQSRIFCQKPEDIKDSNYQYKLFYEFVRNSLLSLCRANVSDDMILDCLIIICYTDEKYLDKAILWNCFPKEMISRAKNEFNDEKSFDTRIYEEKTRRLEERLTKKIEDKKKVVVKVKMVKENRDEKGKLLDAEKIEVDTSQLNVRIYPEEICYIQKANLNSEQKRTLFILLVLYKFHVSNGSRFWICPGSKNRITKTHICKLADINFRNYEEIMKVLLEGEYFKSPTGQTNLLVDISWARNSGKPLYGINEINNIQKYFKYLLTKV